MAESNPQPSALSVRIHEMKTLVKISLAATFLFVGIFTGQTQAAEKNRHLIILAGQSNMGGMLRHDRTFGPLMKAAFPNDELLTIKSARGGQPIRRWYKKWAPANRDATESETAGDLYDQMIKSTKKVIGDKKPDTVTFLWMQGESDAKKDYYEVYAESFNGIITQLKNDLQRNDINFVIGRISDHDKRRDEWQQIRKIQVELANSSDRGAWIDTDEMNGEKDGLHYDKPGYQMLGTTFAKQTIKFIKASAKKPLKGTLDTLADEANIDLVKTFAQGGRYIRLEGRSLFLTSNFNPKGQRAGFWFDMAPDKIVPTLFNKSLPGAWDIAIAADHAFVCDYTRSLKVVDLRDHKWRQVASLKMPSNTENITIRGKFAYVANHVAGLTIVDITDPTKPSIVSNLNPRIDCDGLAFWKNCAVLYGHWESRLVLVDITDPVKPRKTGVYQHDKGTFTQGEVTVDGGLAYCTSKKGLVIVNITDPARTKLVKTVEIKGGVLDVKVMDGYAFLAVGNNGVRVFDVSDPAKAIEVGRCSGKKAQAFELAVRRAPHVKNTGKTTAKSTAPVSYYIYTAANRAAVLRFQPPAGKIAGS